MGKTEDLRVKGYFPLIVPRVLKNENPLTENASNTVSNARKSIENILLRKDRRLLAIVGPCSIHDEKSALEYAARLNALRQKVEQTFVIVMRVYFEKPRTSIGWKGCINDPGMDGSCDMVEGLRKARTLLMKIAEMGLPAGTEMLDPITPQYLSDLVSWGAIGARTTESQTHRELASGLSMPVGFKNSTDGNLSPAINAILAARTLQSFLGIDPDGSPSVVRTAGNAWGHMILRGGKRPNYDHVSVEIARLSLIKNNLPEVMIVDCSHANSMHKFQGQSVVWKNVIDQYVAGNRSLIGMMLESNLFEGNQKFNADMSALRYGVSITDECISWETTESLILSAHERLLKAHFDEEN